MSERSFDSDPQDGYDGGSGSRGDDGTVHYTDSDSKSGTHYSWDEKDGEVSGEHITVHGTNETIDVDD